jgi:Ca2+-binding RTX toxin-like protein
VRRRAALLLSTIGLAVLLAAGAAYALDVQCSPSAGGDVCLGTQEADVLQGTDGLDSIVGLGGDDTIRGLAAPDRLTGDGNAAAAPGDDDLSRVTYAASPPSEPPSTSNPGAGRSSPVGRKSLPTKPSSRTSVASTPSAMA